MLLQSTAVELVKCTLLVGWRDATAVNSCEISRHEWEWERTIYSAAELQLIRTIKMYPVSCIFIHVLSYLSKHTRMSSYGWQAHADSWPVCWRKIICKFLSIFS